MIEKIFTIRDKFQTLGKEQKKAFIPYITAGYPSSEDTLRFFRILEDCGADIIELGVPFTDPLADGPVIEQASQEALKKGMNLRLCLELVEEIRRSSSLPIVLMTYYNPVFKYGEERFVKDAMRRGVNGVIIPDLPPDEAENLRIIARSEGLDTIFLAAPTSTPQRLKLVAEASTGFIYYVSITGITGAKLHLDGSHKRVFDYLRGITHKPIATGFGVSTPEEARLVAEFSDGVIVGSAIVKRLKESEEGLREYLTQISRAIHSAGMELAYGSQSGGERKS